MKAKFMSLLALCGILLTNCTTPKIQEKPKHQKIIQSTKLGLSSSDIFDTTSVGVVKFRDTNSKTDSLDVQINFYKSENSEAILYAIQIQAIQPDFDLTVYKNFEETPEGIVPYENWNIYTTLHKKALQIKKRKNNLTSITYNNKIIFPFIKKDFTHEKEIMQKAFETSEKCKAYLKKIDF